MLGFWRMIGQGLAVTIHFTFGAVVGAIAALTWLIAREANSNSWVEQSAVIGAAVVGGCLFVWLLGKAPRLI